MSYEEERMVAGKPVKCGRCDAGIGRILSAISRGRFTGTVNEFYDIDGNLLHRCEATR